MSTEISATAEGVPSATTAESRSEKPELVVHGGPGGLSRAALRELWLFRDVLSAFAVRQVKVKYKQAAMGIGWAVIQPVVSAAVFAVFVGRVAKVSSEGESYVIFALAGMVAWSYFSTATSGGMESLVADAGLLRKVYFPREILPLAAVLAALVDFAPALAALLVMSAASGTMPSLTWIALPVPLLLLVVSAAAVALGLSGLNVYYRDIRYALPFLLQLGLFFSPVIFSLDALPSAWRTAYSVLNPVAAAIDGMRRIVLHHQWPEVGVTLGALVWALVLTLFSYALFKRLERGFSDRV